MVGLELGVREVWGKSCGRSLVGRRGREELPTVLPLLRRRVDGRGLEGSREDGGPGRELCEISVVTLARTPSVPQTGLKRTPSSAETASRSVWRCWVALALVEGV